MKREASAERGEVIYCVIPRELAEELHEPLRETFRDEPAIEVVVERRNGEQRAGERRRANGAGREVGERRMGPAGERRVAERRAAMAEVPRHKLPPEAAPYADRIRFVKRVLPADQPALDRKADALVVRAKRGDQGAVGELYEQFFDTVYGFARGALPSQQDAEDAAQDVFVITLDTLPSYTVQTGRPFRAWLLGITRNVVLHTLRDQSRVEPQESRLIEERIDAEGGVRAADLEWLSKHNVRLLLDQLLEEQRRVVVMRFLLGFTPAEIAERLQRTPQAVYNLQRRALQALRGCVAEPRGRVSPVENGDGNPPELRSRRAPILVRVRRAPVLRGRRWALEGSLGQPAMLTRPLRRY